MKDRFRKSRIRPDFTLRVQRPTVQYGAFRFGATLADISVSASRVAKEIINLSRSFGKAIVTAQMSMRCAPAPKGKPVQEARP